MTELSAVAKLIEDYCNPKSVSSARLILLV